DRNAVVVAATAAASEHPAVDAEAGQQSGEHRQEARDGHDQYVAFGDVGELVREHAFDLLRLQPLPEATGDGDGRMLRAASGRKGVGDLAVDDGDARLGQIAHGAETLDHVVQLWRLIALDHLRAGGGQRELVGGEVLEEGDPDDDHDHGHETNVQNLEEHDRKDDVEQPEQRAGEDHS